MISTFETRTRGFIFPFVLFFITAGTLLVAEIFSFENTKNSYDTVLKEQDYVQKSLTNEVHIFDTLLKSTNSNGSWIESGSDNDDYSKTGSGGIWTDDDDDAFAYKAGSIEPSISQNILFLNPTYVSYSSNLILPNLVSVTLTVSTTGSLTLYKLDTANRMLDTKEILLVVWPNTIDLTGWNNSAGLALFLKNDSGNLLQYTLQGNWGNIVWATNLLSGHYIYYANLLIPRSNGTLSAFAKIFSK